MRTPVPGSPRRPDPEARERAPAIVLWVTVALIVGVATLMLLALAGLRPSSPMVMPGYTRWHGDYSHVLSFLAWTLGDTTEPGYAHSALAGALMLLGGYAAHRAFTANEHWMGFPVTSGTGLFGRAVGSAALGLVLSNLAWGWTIAVTGMWQPTFVPFASVPAAVVLVYGGRRSVVLTGAVMGAVLSTPIALVAVNFGCRPLGLPPVVGATTGMALSALIAFALCRHLPWMPAARVVVPRCTAGSAHHFVDTARQGPRWLARRMLADFTDAQFIGNEWASAGLLAGTIISYLLNPAMEGDVGNLLPRLLIAQVLTAGLAVTLWHRQWATYGWYPTFVPVVSIAPATVLAFGGTAQAIIAGAVLGALIGPPFAAAVARRLPKDFHPFIGNVVSMAIATAIIVTTLSVTPGFG
ncbi:hypothetical protein EAH80_27750 [Mycobacterium hodleri]|uniref:Uncharacterized protein n=1 Tax=Mycolicibacterium hodleri TaxID=49897 RepID=A0A502DTZ4_9MYCO|nr:hypothetical protein EAH80_27750 [Mycolicibacterium hodleri]